MTQFVAVAPSGAVLYAQGIVDPPDMAEPPKETPEPFTNADGLLVTFYPWNERMTPAPTPTSEPRWVDGALQWVETAALADLKSAAIALTYLDVDKVHFDAVGNRATEYQEAERSARAFAEAGYEGDAEDEVHGFALNNPTGQAQTDRWSAERIIAQADAFRHAQRLMRSARFQRQAEMRAALTADELNTIADAWSGFIASLRVQLGLDPQPPGEA